MSATQVSPAGDLAPAGGAVPTWLAAVSGKGQSGRPSLRLLHHGGVPPATATAGSRSVVFDGHLYNPDELTDPSAQQRSPEPNHAELVLDAYGRLGPSFLDKIRGVFALVILDERDGTLLCARDQMGVYPLFYAETPGEFLVTTSVDALVAHPDVAIAPNRAALADHLCHRWPDREETYLAGVKRVPPAHVLVLRGRERRLDRYWDPAKDPSRIDWIGEDELDRFDELLDRAVTRCLEVGRTGIFLSGGLDSVTVAALAADNGRSREVQALSLIFPHPESNEEDIQRGVASALGLPQAVLPFEQAVGPKGILPTALEMSRDWPMPLLSYWRPGYQTLAEEASRRGCEVVLTGGGGDEWLTVTPVHAADLLLSLDFAGLYRLGRSHRRSYRLSRLRVARNVLWTYGAKLFLSQAAGRAAGNVLRAVAPSALPRLRRRRYERWSPSWVAPDPALRAEIVERSARLWPTQPVRRGEFYIQELRTGLDHLLVSAEMEEAFENGRRAGVLMLQPFLDPDLVEFLYSTPPEFLNQDGRSKGLVRDTLARRFPALGFEKQKKVSGTSYARSVIGNSALESWKQLGGVPALAELGVVDQAKLERELKDVFDQTDLRSSYRVWDALSLEAWVRPRL
jgi:asparagine synthase (glutamine-hydrolysing)